MDQKLRFPFFKGLRTKAQARIRTSLAGFGFFGAAFIGSDAAEAALVEVRVQGATRLSDGSLQVTFENGRSIIVPAGDWAWLMGVCSSKKRQLASQGIVFQTTPQLVADQMGF